MEKVFKFATRPLFPNNTIESVTSIISNYTSIFNSLLKNFIEKWRYFFMERKNKKTKSVGNGEGSLYYSEKLQRWIFQYVYNGKRQTLTQKKNEKVKDFKARVTKIKNDVNNGTYIEKNNETFYNILTKSIDQKYNDGLVSNRTYSRDLSTIKQIEKTCFNFIYKPIQKITIDDIQQAKINMRSYSNSTISKIWSFITKTFRIATSRRKLNYNIMDDESLTKPISKIQDRSIEALSTEEENRLISVLNNEEKNHKYRNIILLQLYTGMRIGEVLALSKDCINIKANTITIYRTITTDIKGNFILGEHTKTYSISAGVDKGQRTFPMSPKVKSIVTQVLKEKITNINGLIFYDHKDNKIITRSEINSYLKRISKKYNITATSLHSHRLRHTYITRCVENGMNLKVIQQIVGHVKGSSITSDIYTSISNDFISEELKKIKY